MGKRSKNNRNRRIADPSSTETAGPARPVITGERLLQFGLAQRYFTTAQEGAQVLALLQEVAERLTEEVHRLPAMSPSDVVRASARLERGRVFLQGAKKAAEALLADWPGSRAMPEPSTATRQ